MLFYTIDVGDLTALRILTKRIGFNVDFDAKGMPPFVYAVAVGKVDVVREMIALGYDMDVVDAKGNIYPCTLDVDKNGLLGNVMIDSFQDVIKKRNKIEYHKFCKECFNYKYKNLEI